MIRVDMEDIIGNAMYDICNYTNKREIDNKTLYKYQEAVFENLREMGIDFIDVSSREEWNELKEYNEYFEILESESGFKIKLKGNAPVENISKYRSYIPTDIINVFSNDKTKEILGLKKLSKTLKK